MDPKRPLLAVVTDDGKCQVWNWERGTLLREWIENAEIGSLQPQLFSNDGAKLLLATINRTNSTSFHEWEIASGRETHSFNIPVRISGSRQVDRLVYSPDGRHAVWFRGSGEGVDAATIDLTTGRMGTLKAKTYRVATGPNFSPDSKVVVVPSFSGLVQILDCPGFTEIATLSGWLFGTHSAGFSVDSKRLVVGSTGQESVTVWDFVSRERLLTLEAHAGTLSPVAFSPDGNVLAGYSSFGASGGNIYFWRAPSWAEIEAAERNDGTKPPQ